MEAAPVMLNVEAALAACRGDLALAQALIEQYRASLPEERTALAEARAVTAPGLGSRPQAGAPLAIGQRLSRRGADRNGRTGFGSGYSRTGFHGRPDGGVAGAGTRL